jgi:hypothetical protein
MTNEKNPANWKTNNDTAKSPETLFAFGMPAGYGRHIVHS